MYPQFSNSGLIDKLETVGSNVCITWRDVVEVQGLQWEY